MNGSSGLVPGALRHGRRRGEPGGRVMDVFDRGIKVDLRFTLTLDNADNLPGLIRLAEDEGVHKFYLSHLNYAGRGSTNRMDDARLETTRRAMDFLFDTAWDYQRHGVEKEFVTGNNDADGVYLLLWARRRFAHVVDHLRAKLAEWGGNSSGVNIANIANIANLGEVHPDTMWWHPPSATCESGRSRRSGPIPRTRSWRG